MFKSRKPYYMKSLSRYDIKSIEEYIGSYIGST